MTQYTPHGDRELIQRRLDRKQSELTRIRDAEEMWFKKLKRAINALDKLRAQKKRLMIPRRLHDHESNDELKHRYHGIREHDFGDDTPQLGPDL